MDDLTLAVKLAMDNSSFQQGIQNLKREMEVVQSQFRESTAGIKDWGKNLDSMKSYADALTQKIDIQKKVVQAYQEQLDKAKQGLEDNAKKMLDLKGKVEQAEQAWKNSKKTLGENAEETQKLKAEYEKLKKEYDQQEQKVRNNQKAVEGYTIQLNNAKAKLNEMESELRQATSEIEKQSNAWLKLSEKAKEVGEKLKSVGDKISNVGKDMTTKITAPIVGAGTAAAKFAIDFEQGMAKVSTIADTTKVPIESLKKGLLDLSTQTGMSVNELTEAEYQAISAGVDTASSVEFLSTAVKAAKGGFTDTKTAVDGLSTVMNAYGLKASEVKRVTDEMMVAQNYGKTSFGEMASSMGKVIPIAASVNVSTKELFASLAVLTKNGISTSEAVTGLKAAMSNIIKPSSEASKLAAQLGIEFNAAHLKSVGWAKFLEEIREKTGGNTEQMAKLFGSVEALNTVMVLAGKGSQDFSTALGLIENAAGTTDQAFEKMNNTTGNKLTKSFNALKNSAIQFGDTIAPIIQRVADVIQTLAEKIQNLSPAQQQMILMFGAIVAAIGPVLLFIGKLISAVGTISTVFGTATGAMATAGAGVTATGGMFAALTSPIGITIAAIAGLIAIFVALYKNNEDFRNSCNEVWNQVKQIISTIVEQIKNIIQLFIQLVSAIWNKWGDDIMNVVQAAFNVVQTIITTVLNVVSVLIKTITAVIKGDWKGAWEGIKQIVDSVWNGMKDIIISKLNLFKTIISSALNVIKDIFSSIWDGVKSLTSGAWEGVKDIIKGTINSIINIINSFIKFWNNIKFTVPSIEVPFLGTFGGWTVGVPQLPEIPYLAAGGILTRPTLAMVGEAGPEAVIPISKLEDILVKVLEKSRNSTFSPNVSIYSPTPLSPSEIARQTRNALRQLGYEWGLT